MNTNQIFNWKRFTALMRKEVVENWRQLSLMMLILYLFLTIALTLINVATDAMLVEHFDIAAAVPSYTLLGTCMLFTVIMASLAFRNLTSKGGRVALLTLPASMTEKYVMNLTLYVIGGFVAFIACSYLADLTRYGILSLLSGGYAEVTPPVNIFSVMLKGNSEIMSMIEEIAPGVSKVSCFNIIVLLFATPAIYFMGSILWPKWSLIKSFIAYKVIDTTLKSIAAAVFSISLGTNVFSMTNFDGGNITNMLLISSYVELALAAILWVASWYLFKRKDIVSLKWWS